jgi:glycosyltransferase involved in cell wall biosynthesis
MAQVPNPTPDPDASPDAADGATLLVILPALDEEQTIGDVIRKIPRAIPGIRSVSVLVIDDGSTDGTAARAAEAGATVIGHPETRGVGAAFQTALAHAMADSPDLLVSIDSDGQFDPAYIPALAAPILAGQADFTSASRFKDPSLTPPMPRLKRWGNRLMSDLVSHIVGRQFFDVSCGMRCYSRKAIMHLTLMGQFTYTQEVFLNLAFKGLRIVEVPIPVRGQRPYGQSRVARSLWRYGWQALRIIFRCYRDYRPMRFFGAIALACAIPAILLEGFLAVHYLMTGGFSPHKWAGFTGLGLFVVALGALQIGVIGDMLDRHRIYLEELIYNLRMNGWRDRTRR